MAPIPECLILRTALSFTANSLRGRESAVKRLMVYREVLIEQVLKIVQVERFGYKGIW